MIRVTKTDRRRIGSLLASEENRALANQRCRDDLEWILEQSKPVESPRAAENLITMDSTFRLIDLATGTPRVVTLIYPSEVDFYPEGISVLSPLGTRLLGRRSGDVVQCPAARCDRRFQIAEVVTHTNGRMATVN